LISNIIHKMTIKRAEALFKASIHHQNKWAIGAG